MNLYLYMFSLPILLISNLMMFFFSSSLFMWMTMEINLISFISFMINLMNSEMMIMYFLIQTMNSYIFLMASTLSKFSNFDQLNILIMISMMSKLGMPPFHFWYFKFMKFLNWNLFFIASSFQKLIPLMILNMYMIMKNNLLIFMLILLMISLIITPLLAMNTKSIKMILIYSSLIQMSWIMSMMIFNNKLWIIFFLIYSVCLFSVIEIFKYYNINYIYEMSKIPLNMKFFMIINILSLSGLPPFLGFLTKWMYMNLNVQYNSFYFNIFIMVLSSLNFFFYIKMSFKCLILWNYNLKMFKKNNLFFMKFKMILVMLLSMLTLTIYEIF